MKTVWNGNDIKNRIIERTTDALSLTTSLLLVFGGIAYSQSPSVDPAYPQAGMEQVDSIKAIGKTLSLGRTANGDLLVARCTLNGKTCRLIVDTGASHTTFDQTFIEKEFPHISLIPLQITKSGNVNTPPKAFIAKSFSVGDLTIRNTMICTTDLSAIRQSVKTPIDGILGMNHLGTIPFLLSVREATLSFPNPEQVNRLRLFPLDVQRRSSGLLTIGCTVDNGPIFRLLLDSGSSLSFAPEKYWKAAPQQTISHTNASDINGHGQFVNKRGEPTSLRLGKDFVLRNVSFIVTDKGGHDQIGVDTLRSFDILVDAQNTAVFAIPSPQQK